MTVLPIQALALLLTPPLARATFTPSHPSKAPRPANARRRYDTALFLHPSSSARRQTESSRAADAPSAVAASSPFAPDHLRSGMDDAAVSCSYVPPYGTVPRSSVIVMGMAPGYARGGGNDSYPDDRFRKKMNSRRTKDPVVQDFGDARDWSASRNGLGRMGDDKVGDDGVSEAFGAGGPMAPGRRPPPPPMMRDGGEEMFEGEGGNYWVNPPNSMDRYPVGGNDGAMAPRRRGRRARNRRGSDGDDEWWETVREDDGEDEFNDLDEDFEYEDDVYPGDYGVPPPSRSRSSFRSGAPPPPGAVKGFYDRLFWFGFDSDVTRSTDRTMFGGTRGKFNAVGMLRDREERQRMREGRGGVRTGGGGGPRRRKGRDPVVQDFGSVGDWNERKTGQGRAGGAAVGDDRERPYYGYESSFDDGFGPGGPAAFPGDAPPPPGVSEYDFEPGNDEDFLDFEGGGRTRGNGERGGRSRRRDSRRRDTDGRAGDYDRFLSGGAVDDDYPPGSTSGRRPPPSARRRRGYAYKYDRDDLLNYSDGEYIDVEPKYATERDLDMARGTPPASDGRRRSRRRRSWEERAVEMDRVPPRDAVAWGPDGRVASGETPLDRAAMEALGDIRESKRRLEDKERAVDESKEEVVGLKSDASLCENRLENARGGRERDKLEGELGYILSDVDDASRDLRVARAERDVASDRVSRLEERNWALLSEYEAVKSFEEEIVD